MMRLVFSTAVIAGSLMAAIMLRGNTMRKVGMAVNCTKNSDCDNIYNEAESILLKKAICEDVACALKNDSIWGQLITCNPDHSVHETIDEIMAVLQPLGLKPTTVLPTGNTNVLSIQLSSPFTESSNVGIRIDFVQYDNGLKVTGIYGLCSTLTQLSELKSRKLISALTLQ